MQAALGLPIDLSLSLLRNAQPWGGQTVSVRVVRQSDGVEVLAETALSEVDTALYTYEWADPPAELVSLRATYLVNELWYSTEDIRIAKSGGGASSTELLSGIIEETETLEGVVEETETLEGVVEETETLEGVVGETETLEGVVEETKTLAGIVEDAK